MKASEIQKYFLALQFLPGDNAFIDTTKLNISNGIPAFNLSAIDALTINYTYDELMQSIKEANIVDEKYLNGKLVIADNQKHNPLDVITKEVYQDFDLLRFFADNESDKNLMNTVNNKFYALTKEEDLISDFKNANIFVKTKMIFDLPYIKQRKLILYIINDTKQIIKEKEKKKELKRNDAA